MKPANSDAPIRVSMLADGLRAGGLFIGIWFFIGAAFGAFLGAMVGAYRLIVGAVAIVTGG